MIEPLTDLAYLAVTAGLTFLVSRSLRRRGSGSLVTFHLVAFAFIALLYRWGTPRDFQQAADYLSSKLGLILLVLGALHSVKSWQLSRPRKEVQS